jgi:hypothetical protein
MSENASTDETPTVSFVKRAVLKSEDGGNTYNVEVEDLIKDNSANAPRVSLYDQLQKTLTERRAQRVEGRPEELTVEDQEFVNRVQEQKQREAAMIEEEAREFKRQRMLTVASEAQKSSTISTADASVLMPASLGMKQKSGETPSEDSVVIVVKKKKKRVEESSVKAST